MSWSLNKTGTRAGVIRAIRAFETDDTQFGAVRDLLISEIEAVTTNGVVLEAHGNSDPHYRSLYIKYYPQEILCDPEEGT